MKKENILAEKSYAFAIRIIKLSQYLIAEKREYVLSKQIMRSGTSIGALVSESKFAQSQADFEHKSLHQDIDQLIRLLASITKTLKNKGSTK